MRRGDHVFEDRALLLLEIERAVGEDVRLDPFVDAHTPLEPRVHRVDLVVLPRPPTSMLMPRAIGRPYEWSVTPMRVHPSSNAPSARSRDRLGAVAPRGVHLEIAEIALRGHDRRRQRRVERQPHRVPAQVRATEACGASRTSERFVEAFTARLHRRGRPGLHQLRQRRVRSPRRRRARRAARPLRSDRRPIDRRPPASAFAARL